MTRDFLLVVVCKCSLLLTQALVLFPVPCSTSTRSLEQKGGGVHLKWLVQPALGCSVSNSLINWNKNVDHWGSSVAVAMIPGAAPSHKGTACAVFCGAWPVSITTKPQTAILPFLMLLLRLHLPSILPSYVAIVETASTTAIGDDHCKLLGLGLFSASLPTLQS